MRPRRAAMAGAAALALVLAGSVPEGSADPAPALTITGVRPSAERIQFFVTASGTPASPALTPPGLAVSIGGVRVDATARSSGVSSPPAGAVAPRTAAGGDRIAVVVLDARWLSSGDPMTAALAVAEKYARTLPDDVRLGLVVVADQVRTALAPTIDRAAFSAELDTVIPEGDTPYEDGVRQAMSLLGPAGARTERRLLVLSDGSVTGPDGVDDPSAGPSASGEPSPSAAASPEPSAAVSPEPSQPAVAAPSTELSPSAGASAAVSPEPSASAASPEPSAGASLEPAPAPPVAVAGARAAVDVVYLGVDTIPGGLRALAETSGGQVHAVTGTDASGRISRATASTFPPSLVVTARTPAQFVGKATTLAADITVGGRRLSGSVAVTIPVAGKDSGGSGRLWSGWLPKQIPPIVYLGLLVLPLLLVAGIGLTKLATRWRRHRRLKAVIRYPADGAPKPLALSAASADGANDDTVEFVLVEPPASGGEVSGDGAGGDGAGGDGAGGDGAGGDGAGGEPARVPSQREPEPDPVPAMAASGPNGSGPAAGAGSSPGAGGPPGPVSVAGAGGSPGAGSSPAGGSPAPGPSPSAVPATGPSPSAVPATGPSPDVVRIPGAPPAPSRAPEAVPVFVPGPRSAPEVSEPVTGSEPERELVGVGMTAAPSPAAQVGSPAAPPVVSPAGSPVASPVEAPARAPRWMWRRRSRFAAGLSEALPLLVSAVAAGQPLPEAVGAVAALSPEPVRGEFQRALATSRTPAEAATQPSNSSRTADGKGGLTGALAAVADRYGSSDLADIVRALRLNPALGADPARAVRAAEQLIRDRRRLDAHAQALSGAGRLAAGILASGAVVSGVAAAVLRDGGVRPFYAEPLGMALLACAGLLVVLGGLWMTRLAKVEV